MSRQTVKRIVELCFGVRRQPVKPQRRASDRRPTEGDSMQALRYHSYMGNYYREQMEAHAHSCCEILGIDPECESKERDWANEIVYHGTDPQLVVDRILELSEDEVIDAS